MNIVKVETFPLSFPLEVAARDATGVWDSWDTVIVRLTASDGTVGYGEIGPVHGGGVLAFKALVDYRIAPRILGEDPLDRERLFQKMLGQGTSAYAFGEKGAIVSAIAGIEMALWDLTGKILKTPVYQLLGGRVLSRIPAYASGFFGKEGRPLTPKECAEEARRYADQGFKGIKMKIGYGRKRDLENLEAVRTTLGPDLGIMVDANQGFTVAQVLQLSDELAAFDLTFLEEPISIHDVAGMSRLSATVPIPLAAGENYYTHKEFRDLVTQRAVSVVQPDVIHVGGIGEAKKVAVLAEAFGMALSPHIHATVGVAASIQLLASCPHTLAAEYITSGGSYDLRRALLGDAYMVDREGYVPVPDDPGLGIQVNTEALERYGIRG